jgi:hypothetical protein
LMSRALKPGQLKIHGKRRRSAHLRSVALTGCIRWKKHLLWPVRAKPYDWDRLHRLTYFWSFLWGMSTEKALALSPSGHPQ